MKFEKIKGPQNHHIFRPFDAKGAIRDVYWVRFHRSGRGRLEESLKTTHLGEAREKRDVRIAEFLGEKPRRASKVFLVEDKFQEFLDLKKGKAPATYASMKNQWEKHLKAYFGGMILDEVTETEWIKYVNEKRQKFPERKFFNDRKYLSMFMHWLHRDGLISKIHKLPDVDPEIKEGIVYSNDQVRGLLKKADLWLRAQIYLGVTMGMRIGEIMSLEWYQVDFDQRTIHLPAEKTKIRKERTFGMSVKGRLYLRRLKRESKGTAVFASPQDPNKTQGRDGNKKVWNKCKSESGIPRFYRFHWLRHTFLTHAFKRAVNPALICEYAGLSLDEAQKTYLHFTVEDTRVVASLVGVLR